MIRVGEVQLNEYGKLLEALKMAQAENARLRSEIKNFVSAFDEYFVCVGRKPIDAEKVDDAGRAMFSAAMQARAALAGSGEST